MSLMLEELAAEGCPLLAIVLLTVAVSVLARHGSAEQRATWLPGIADGSTRLAFAITEPDAGTNAHALRTTAKIGRAACRARVCQSVSISVVAVSLKTKNQTKKTIPEN